MEIREQILEKSAEMFEQLGVKRVSMDDICQELHISKKTIYVYFGSKEDLLSAVLDYVDEKMQKKMREYTVGLNSKEVLELVIQQINTVRPKHEGKPLWYDLQKYYPEVAKAHEEKASEVMCAGLKTYLSRGVEEGFFREDLDVDLFVRVFEPMHDVLRDVVDGTEDKQHACAFFVDLFRRMVVK